MGVYVEPRRAKPYGAILTAKPVDPVKPPTPKPPTGGAVPLIQYVELRNMEGRLEDTYKNHGGHPPRTVTLHVNAEGEVWREHYFTRRNAGMPHEQAIRSIESEIDVIEGRPDRWATSTPPPITTPPPAGSFRRIEGELRRVGKHFHDDRGYISPRGASLLYGLADGVDAEPAIALYAAEGIQYVRVFAGELPRIVNGQDRGYQQTSGDARARLPALLALAERYGLRVQVCAITDSALVRYDVYQHVAGVAAILAGRLHWLEGGNEVEDGEQDQGIDWRRVLDQARAAGYTGLFTVGAAKLDELDVNTGTYWPAEIGDFASTHPWREAEPHWMGDGCRLREGEGIQSTHGVPIAFGEPDRADKWPDGYAFLIGALGAGFNAAVVLHTNDGRDCKPLTGHGLACLRAFVQGHQALEAGPWQWQNAQRPGHWPQSPCIAGAFEEGDYGPPHMLPGGHVWRVFSFLKDGRGVSVPTGHRPEDPGAFQIGNGYRQGSDRGARPGVRLVEVAP